ncbi:hypothetical protein [Oleisolibacter albus]|uniref:hypothetical protein n=1 Tax=Oleisolibacter albus TaxID=2171757 RepID=UPI000DF10E48|nr:hypothetical protein [Oleisolibacter albus]
MWLEETDLSAARGDLLAWAGGGVVWGVVSELATGAPVGLLLGATLALLLRRVFRSVAEF